MHASAMTDLDFGPLVLGGNVFGWTTDRDEGFRVLDAFLDGGGRSIDTANVYANGESERIIGAWLSSRGVRDRVVLATKLGAGDARPGLAPDSIAAAADESLERLGVDHVELLYAHRDDPSVPQDEVLGAFDALVRAGKVREIGASNFAPDRLRSAAAVAARHGTVSFTVTQDHWNLVEREAETELVPVLDELGIVQLPYFGLASGFLTGKYRPGGVADSARASRAAAYLDDPRSVAALDVLDDVAADHRTSVAAVALAWLAAQRTVAAPIASARTTGQLTDLLAAGGVRLSAQELALLSATTEPVGC